MTPYRLNVFKLYLFTFLVNLHFIGGVLVPFFTQWGKISFSQLMVLQTFFLVAVFLLEAPTGAVADKFGRKISIFLGALCTALGVLVYTSEPSYALFFVGELLWAFGTAFISGADSSLLYDSLKQSKDEKKSKKILGRFASLDLIALMIAAPIGGLIAHSYGLEYAMFFMLIPLLLASCVALTVREPTLGRKKAQKRSYVETLRGGFSFFLTHRILKLMAFDSAISFSLVFFTIWVYQYKLQELGLPLSYYGFVHAGMVLTQICILNSFPFLEKIVGKKSRLILLTNIIPGFFLILLGVTTSIPVAIASAIIIVGCGLPRGTLYQNYMHKYIPSDRRATVLSTISMMRSGTMALNNLVMGLLIAWSLTYSLVLLGTVIILFSLVIRVKEGHLRD